jgi:hypothetical protein
MAYLGTKPASQIIDSTLIADGVIVTADLANSAVTTAKIADANVTQAKLASGVAGNGPAFSAYQSSAQSISGATNTKIQFQTEVFDTNNNFDPTTNYRFTPTVAGYYQVSAGFSVSGAAQVQQCKIYKNGSTAIDGSDASVTQSAVTGLLYLNGSTDYIEAYAFSVNVKTIDNLASRTYFQASLVRAA